MARPKRLKLKDEEGFFHIMSRTVGQEFYLGDVEKEKLFNSKPDPIFFLKKFGLVPISIEKRLRFFNEYVNISL